MVQPGDVILDVPEEAIVCRRTGLKHSKLAPVLKDSVLGRDSFSGLVLLLMYESQDAHSFWKPFLSVLPTQFDTPIFWPDSTLEIIKETPLYHETMELRSALRNIYTREIQPLNTKFSDLLSSLDWSFDRFTWAISTVWNRAYWIDEDSATPGIVPLADMMNHWDDSIHNEDPSSARASASASDNLSVFQHAHNAEKSGQSLPPLSLQVGDVTVLTQLQRPQHLHPHSDDSSHNTHSFHLNLSHLISSNQTKPQPRAKSDYKFDPETKSFRVTSGWTFLPGDEVFTCYGRKDNETLLADYAFVIPELNGSLSNRFSLDVSYACAPYSFESGYIDKFKASLEHIGITDMPLDFLMDFGKSPRLGSCLSSSNSSLTSNSATPLPLNNSTPDPCHLLPQEPLPVDPGSLSNSGDLLGPSQEFAENLILAPRGELPSVVISEAKDKSASKEEAGEEITPPASEMTSATFQPPPLLSYPSSSESLLTDSYSESDRSEKRSFLKIDPSDCRQLLAFCRLLQLSSEELDTISASNAHELFVPTPPPPILAGDEVERRALLEALRILELQPIIRHWSSFQQHQHFTPVLKDLEGAPESLKLAHQFTFWYCKALHDATSQLRDYLAYCVQCIQ